MRMASMSMSAANNSSTKPIHGTGSVETTKLPAEFQNFGTVIETRAQVLMVYMKAVGRPVTSQTHQAFCVLQSQIVTPSNVKAAKSWLLAPNRFQKIRQTSTGAVDGCRRRKNIGTPAVSAVANQRPNVLCQPVSSWRM